MVNRDALKVKFTMGARMLLFKRYPELKELLYTKKYITVRFFVYAAQIVGILLVFIAPLLVGLALILYAHYVSTRLIRYVSTFLLEMTLADPSFYEYAVRREYIIIEVVPWARKQL